MSDSDSIRLPEIIVFAGPNGSGKTTVTRMAKTIGVYINADDIKRTTLFRISTKSATLELNCHLMEVCYNWR